MSTDTPSSVRRPSLLAAFVVAAVYIVIFIGLLKASGIAYTDIVETAENTWRGIVVPLAAGAVWLVIVAVVTKWEGLFVDPRRLSMGFVLWLVPVLMVVTSLMRFGGVDWSALVGSHIAAIVVGGLLVGFTEETLFRGVFVSALRNGTRAEGPVMLISSLLFGVFHATNLIVGSPLSAVGQQVVIATIFGLGLYLARRARGVLLLAMAVHALWDMSTFAIGAALLDESVVALLAGLVQNLALLAAIVGLVIVWRRKDVVAVGG